MMDVSKSDLMEVGVVTGTHGLRGDLKVRTMPTGELALPGARSIYLQDGGGRLARHEAVRSTVHKQGVLLRLAGYDSIDAATPLVGSTVWMARADLPQLAEDRYYWADLEGLEVIDRRLGALGRVSGMFTTPAHDILEVDGASGEILVPAVAPFLVRVDRAAMQLHVDLPDGLADLGASPS